MVIVPVCQRAKCPRCALGGTRVLPCLYIAARARHLPRCACKYFGGDPVRLLIPFRVLRLAISKDREFLQGARIRVGPPAGFWHNLKKNFGRPKYHESNLPH